MIPNLAGRRLRPTRFSISVYSHPGSRERLLQVAGLSLPTRSACTAVPVTRNWSKWKRRLRRWLLPKSPTFCHVACVDGMRLPFCPLPCPPQCQPVSDFSQQIAEHCSCWFPRLFERCRFRGELVVLAISGSPQLSVILVFRLGQPLPLRPTAPAQRLPPAALRCPSASPYFPCLSFQISHACPSNPFSGATIPDVASGTPPL